MRLIDADALTKSITDWYCDPERCNNYGGVMCRACHVDDALSCIDQAPTVNEWFSVREHLPVSGKSYLTIGPRGVMRVAEAYVPAQALPTWGGDPGTVWWRCEGKFVAATHWMEKPAPPPKEGEVDGGQ